MSKYAQLMVEIGDLKAELEKEKIFDSNSRMCQEIEEKISHLEYELELEKEKLSEEERSEALEMFRLMRERAEEEEKHERDDDEWER